MNIAKELSQARKDKNIISKEKDMIRSEFDKKKQFVNSLKAKLNATIKECRGSESKLLELQDKYKNLVNLTFNLKNKMTIACSK